MKKRPFATTTGNKAWKKILGIAGLVGAILWLNNTFHSDDEIISKAEWANDENNKGKIDTSDDADAAKDAE